MATLKYYLDTRRALADGTYPLKLRISVRSNGAYLSTDIRLKEANWDAVKMQAKGIPNKDRINSFLRSNMVAVENALLDLRMQGKAKGKTAMQLRDMLHDIIFGEEIKERILFADYFNKIAEEKKNQTTKTMYITTLKLLKRIDGHISTIAINDIDENYLRGILDKLSADGQSNNSISIYFSHIRMVITRALDDKIIKTNPIKRIKVVKEKTIKRNLLVDELRSILNMQITDGNQGANLDAFKLTFFLIGINSVDLYNMLPDALQDGRIHYIRAKTKKLYSIKVEPEAAAIIEKYRGKTYLFNFAEHFKTQKSFVNAINATMKTKIDKKLSTYYARHSWATIAHSIGIDKDTISLALGHSFGVSVTDTYIDYDAEKIDAANRKVIDWVLYGKK